MKRKKIWDYMVYATLESQDPKQHHPEYKSWAIICEESPETGWGKIFASLSEAGELRGLIKIESTSCVAKEWLVLE